MGVCVPRQERDHRSIAQDRLFLLPWGRPVNKVNPMGTKKRGGTALGRRRSKKRRLTQRKEGAFEAYLLIRERKGKGATFLSNNKKGGEIGDRSLASKPARPRGIKRSFPVLTWISGDGKRRPEATSSRGRSLALADRLAVSLATAKRLPSAKERAFAA